MDEAKATPQTKPAAARRPFLGKWRQYARRLESQVTTLYLASRHPRTPWHAKAFSAGVVAYFLSPIDLVPDFIPVLGYLDDLILVPLGILLAMRMIPPDVLAECREEAERRAEARLSKGWGAAAAVVGVWLVVAALAGALVVWRVR